MKRLLLFLLILAGFFTAGVKSEAQCTSVNTAFKSGETLVFDLYFNWKFVWIKVGIASMSISDTYWQGEPAYKAYLITRGSNRADKFFVMRDTLTSYVTHDLTPRRYVKGAEEGKSYRRDEVNYFYEDGQCRVEMSRRKDGGEIKYNSFTSKYCAYDMISMLLRARSFDATNYKVGHSIPFIMADGKRCEWQRIVYRGKDTFTIEGTNTTYRCLVFSFIETEDGKESEVAKFYITDDANHLPVRVDMTLNFGTAKAFLTAGRNLRNPQDAKIE